MCMPLAWLVPVMQRSSMQRPAIFYNGTSLNRLLAAAVIASVLLAQSPPQAQQGQLDGSETLFTVLAAINVAGYDADLDSPANSPIRRQVRSVIVSKNLTSVEELKKFVADHRQKNPEAELSQYLSLALTLEGPPNFQSRLKPEEIPFDARGLEGFDRLIANFYQQAGIQELWKQARPAHEEVIGKYHSGVTKALLEANAYLRNATSGFLGRHFQIYVDLLGAPNQIQTRSYKDDYFVVLTPSPETQIEEILPAALDYLLAPLSLRYSEQVNRLKGVADFAQPAPALEESY